MELLNPTEFADIYEAQIKIGELYNYLLSIQFDNKILLQECQNQCIVLAAELGGGYFTDAHWLKEPLSTTSAYHLYCLQIVKE